MELQALDSVAPLDPPVRRGSSILQAKVVVKRKGEEEEEDVTGIPWDGQYGPDPPKDTAEGGGVGGIQGVVQWEEATGAAGGAGEGENGASKKQKVVVRAIMGGGSSGHS